jgi:hypothetical protein
MTIYQITKEQPKDKETIQPIKKPKLMQKITKIKTNQNINNDYI